MFVCVFFINFSFVKIFKKSSLFVVFRFFLFELNDCFRKRGRKREKEEVFHYELNIYAKSFFVSFRRQIIVYLTAVCRLRI